MSETLNRRDDEFRERMQTLIDSALPPDVQERIVKKIKDAAYEFENQVEYWLKDELAYLLAGYVEDMANRAIEAMLAGNEAMFRRYLHCEHGGYTGRDREHPVIHGELFEASMIELRRKLCDAHPDLLKTERVLDLESQVAGLVTEVNKREAEIERLRDRVRNCDRD